MAATTATRRGRKTLEERQAEAKGLHEALTDRVQQLTETGEWQRYLAFLGSFHAYSLTNVLLIWAQRPDATLVAGFRQWQAKGRAPHPGGGPCTRSMTSSTVPTVTRWPATGPGDSAPAR